MYFSKQNLTLNLKHNVELKLFILLIVNSCKIYQWGYGPFLYFCIRNKKHIYESVVSFKI